MSEPLTAEQVDRSIQNIRDDQAAGLPILLVKHETLLTEKTDAARPRLTRASTPDELIRAVAYANGQVAAWQNMRSELAAALQAKAGWTDNELATFLADPETAS